MKDDKRYFELMDLYKSTRIKDRKGAIKYLKEAKALRKNGEVSEDAVIGAAYL